MFQFPLKIVGRYPEFTVHTVFLKLQPYPLENGQIPTVPKQRFDYTFPDYYGRP
jgi:hypothetical protein